MASASVHRQHEYWWQSLAAVPASERTHDWWSTQTAGRGRPYDRLRRVWADQTSPRDNLHDPGTERHLTASLWENFVLVHPSVWIPRLLRDAGLPLPSGEVVDACWSYEFEQSSPGTRRCEKIADVVVHYRDGRGDALLVVEAKNLGRDLGRSDNSKDRDPGHYLTMRAFEFVPPERRCHMYLVDAAKREIVAGQVVAGNSWRYAVFTWQQLAAVQTSLANEMIAERQLAWTAAALIEDQFATHGIAPLGGFAYASRWRCDTPNEPVLTIGNSNTTLSNGKVAVLPWSVRFQAEEGAAVPADGTALPVDWQDAGPMASLQERFVHAPPHLLQFVAGALQFRLGREGALPHPAFRYLQTQPSFRKSWTEYQQQVEERTEPLWRLP